MKDYDRFREEKRQYSYRWIAEHGVPVKKGLKELLIYLKGHNIKTAVATASSESWTQGNVRGAGVEKYFDDYIYGDMVKEAKPNPAIFLLAARRLGVDPGACVVLEDSFNGIKSPSILSGPILNQWFPQPVLYPFSTKAFSPSRVVNWDCS